MENDKPPPAAESEGHSRLFSQTGAVFWAAAVIGALLRVYCVIFTPGTGDMDDWEDHAKQVHDLGLIGYYHANEYANHPPFISELESLIFRVAEVTRVPFRILFRAPFALLDAGTAVLLLALLPENRWRFLLAGCYWLSPAAIILSSYHGNTDSAVAFLLLFCVWLLTKGRLFAAAVVLGSSFWIKLPGLLAIPALILFLPTWRRRFLFLSTAGVIAISTYLPALIQDFKIVATNVFGYRGLILQTAGGVPLWGPSALLSSMFGPIDKWPAKYLQPTLLVLENSWQIGIALMLILIWLRRNRGSPQQICATIAMAYVILYAFSDYWAFQYFAWSLPFWLFLPRWFSLPGVAVASAYLYSLHWLFSGGPSLRGGWDFGAHPALPAMILGIRDIGMILFLVSACVFLVLACRPGQTNAESLAPANDANR